MGFNLFKKLLVYNTPFEVKVFSMMFLIPYLILLHQLKAHISHLEQENHSNELLVENESVTLISSSLLSKTIRGVLNFPVTTHEPSGISRTNWINTNIYTISLDTEPNV